MNRTLLLGSALILAAGLTAACDSGVVDLRDDLYAVHSLLMAGADTATVRVTRNDPRIPLGEEAVEGARVRLVHSGDTTTLDEIPTEGDAAPNPGASGWYGAAVPGGWSTGEDVELIVDLPGRVITGRTRILRTPEIVTPQPRLRIQAGDSMRIPVQVLAPEAAGGELGVETTLLHGSSGPVPQPDCLFRRLDPDRLPSNVDEIRAIRFQRPICRGGEPLQVLSWDSLDVRLVAVTFDSAYVSYARTAFDAGGAYLPHASAGVVGAMGFFASAAEAAVPLRIISGGPAAVTATPWSVRPSSAAHGSTR